MMIILIHGCIISVFYLLLFPVLGIIRCLASRVSMPRARIAKSTINSTNCSPMAVPAIAVSSDLCVLYCIVSLNLYSTSRSAYQSEACRCQLFMKVWYKRLLSAQILSSWHALLALALSLLSFAMYAFDFLLL